MAVVGVRRVHALTHVHSCGLLAGVDIESIREHLFKNGGAGTLIPGTPGEAAWRNSASKLMRFRN